MASSIIKSQTAINQIIERTLLDGSCILVRIAPHHLKEQKNGIINNHTAVINSHTAINQTIERTLLDGSSCIWLESPRPQKNKRWHHQ